MASRSRTAAAAEPDSDEDDYVFYGTKLYDEEGLATGTVPTGSRPDPATTRSLPVHQQVATDEQGRKRFHGAFTGGFSAGYYNTVGSKVCVLHSRPCLLRHTTVAVARTTHKKPASRKPRPNTLAQPLPLPAHRRAGPLPASPPAGQHQQHARRRRWRTSWTKMSSRSGGSRGQH